jgi:hypothetical protein
LVIDEQSEGHGMTPIDLSTKPGQPQIDTALEVEQQAVIAQLQSQGQLAVMQR